MPRPFLLRQLAAVRNLVIGTPLPEAGQRGVNGIVNAIALEVANRGLPPEPTKRDRHGAEQPRCHRPFYEPDGFLAGERGTGVGGVAGAVRADAARGVAMEWSAFGTYGADAGYRPTPHNYPAPKGAGVYTCEELLVRTDGDVIRQLYATGKTTAGDGTEKKLVSAVNPVEGKHLYDIVRSNGFTRTLEVGMANGMSTLHIGQAVKDNGGGMHVALDPFQNTQWGGTAIMHCERAGLADTVRCVEEKSYLAMPRLLSEGHKFQFVFIDGMHMFDYTLLDFFFADLLLEVGGVVCVDDIRHAGVGHSLDYVRTNYPHFVRTQRTMAHKTMSTYIKVAEDGRGWDFHDAAFSWRQR